MNRSLGAISAAFVLAITLAGPVAAVPASGKITVSACATNSDALRTTVAWNGVAVSSYGIGIYDVDGTLMAGAGSGLLAKPVHRLQWTVTMDISASSVGSVVGGGFDSKAGAPIELTVTAPWVACPAGR